jgi:hypothetical protein
VTSRVVLSPTELVSKLVLCTDSTLLLHYKEQLYTGCLFWLREIVIYPGNDRTPLNMLCGKNSEFLNVKGADSVTAVL